MAVRGANSGKDRRQYAAAARLIACAAEAVNLAKDPEAGTFLITQWRDRYPRHVAFRSELEKAVRKTPLVVAPTRTGRR